jgi:hypothetical protein
MDRRVLGAPLGIFQHDVSDDVSGVAAAVDDLFQ